MAGELLPARLSLRSQLWFSGDSKVLRNRHLTIPQNVTCTINHKNSIPPSLQSEGFFFGEMKKYLLLLDIFTSFELKELPKYILVL